MFHFFAMYGPTISTKGRNNNNRNIITIFCYHLVIDAMYITVSPGEAFHCKIAFNYACMRRREEHVRIDLSQCKHPITVKLKMLAAVTHGA